MRTRVSLFLGVLVACGGGELTTPTATPSEAFVPDFAYVRDVVFTPSCAFSSCHGAGLGAGGLNLSADKAYDQLVNVPSAQRPEVPRVVPGDADASYLMWKLEGDAAIVDDAMPPPNGGLDAERIAAVRAWINAGALND